MAKRKKAPMSIISMQLCHSINRLGHVVLGTTGASFVIFDSQQAAAVYLRQVANDIENSTFSHGKSEPQ